MKQYLYITLLLLYCWTGSAQGNNWIGWDIQKKDGQNRIEAIYTYTVNGQVYERIMPFSKLKSINGKYVFEAEISNGEMGYPGLQYIWVIKNTISNEVLFRTKPFVINIPSQIDPNNSSILNSNQFGHYILGLFLHFNTINNFKLINCSSKEKCKDDIDKTIPFKYDGIQHLNAAPYITISGYQCFGVDRYGNCSNPGEISIGDLFGIEGSQVSKTTYNTNPELASTMVYQDRGDGWYTVPEYYQAKALLLTDEGDLQIVNTKEQVIWSLKQSQQDDKHFIAKGNTDPIQTASLVHTPEGHIELSNSKYQQEFDLNFLAKDYVLLSASNNKASELSVTSPNSMISMQVYQNSPTTSTAKSGLTSKSSTAKINPTESPKLLVIPDQKNGVRNIAKIETKKTAKTAKIVKIEKPMPTNTFTVFPNPVKDIINIVFDDTTETLTKVQILSLDGRIIREFTGSQTPNIQELSSGMYLYLIESTKNKYNGKIIKQ